MSLDTHENGPSMHIATSVMSADELLRMPADRSWFELDRGHVLEMSPPGALHAVCTNRLATVLTQFVERHRLGLVFPQDSGFLLATKPDTVRATDVAFVRASRLGPAGIPDGYWPGAPDLAVEVMSPSDRESAVEAKMQAYFAAGTELAWVVHPRQQVVVVLFPDGRRSALGRDDTLTGEHVLPGFAVRVGDVLGVFS